MSFLSGLFKKKPGGTFVGNLFRGVASTATGGILGSGANKIEYGESKTNKEIGTMTNAERAEYEQGKIIDYEVQLPDVQVYAKGNAVNPSDLIGTSSPQSIVNQDTTLDKVVNAVDRLTGAFQPQVTMKADNSQMFLFGGLGLLAVLIMTKK